MASQQQQDVGRWASRPRAAKAVRVIAYVLPIVIASVGTWFIARAFPRPRGFTPAVIWFLTLTIIATGILFVIDKIARRLLPLAALLQLSLVFPDRAPSRFRTALRTQTVHQLEESVAEIKRDGLPNDPTLAAETLIDLVAALSVHDHLTRGHAERVRAYSWMIGDELKLDGEDLEFLTWAGLLHDVGKLFVPAEILNKPGRLTDEEFDIIKGHPGWGAELCEPLRGWLGDWVDAVGEHHERWEGGGYPSGIAGEEISLSARIVSVADVFDVITNVRSYKPAESAADAREELARCAGTQFDPAIVRAFLNISLGRLRLAMGPLSWFAQLPFVGRIPLAPAAAAVSVAATWAALLAAGVLGQIADTDTYTTTVEAADVVVTTTTPPPPPPIEPIVIATAPPATAPRPVPESTTTASPTTAPPATAQPTAATTPPATTTPPTTTPPATAQPTAATTPPTTTTPPTITPPTTTTTTTVPPNYPVAVDDVAVTDEGGGVDIDVALNDTNATSALVTSPPSAGLVTQLSATLLRFTPPTDWFGTTTFVYELDNGTGVTDTATVTVTVNPLPDAPVANDETATVDEDATVVISALGNDTDADGDTLTITGVSSTDGTPTTDGTTITYTPAPGSSGTHTLSYTISDGTGLMDTATVSVTVNPVPDAPIAGDDTATVDEDVTVTGITVLTNDTDGDGDTLTITGVSSTDGTPTTDGATIDYTPAPNSNGAHTINYTINDGTGLTDTATISVTVNPVPDAPIAGDNGASLSEDTTINVSVLLNDSDPDGDPLTVISATSTDGTASTDGTTVTYAPAPDSNGTHIVTYTIDDGTGLTDTAIITVTVNPLNDAPVANDDIGGGYSTTTDVAFTTANVTTNDTDVDSPIDPTSVTVISTTTNGVLTNNADGTFDYAPNASYSGTDSFTYEITDAGGLTSNTATATIDIATGSTSGLVVSEFSNVGAGLAGDFIELYNGTTGSIDIEGWTLEIADNAAIAQTIPLTGTETLIPPGGHYLIAASGARDQSMSPLDDSVAIRVRDGGVIHDEVGTRARNNAGTVPAALWSEGTGLPPLVDSIGSGASWERKAGRNNGNCVDSDNNSADFTKNYYAPQANAQTSWDADTPCGTPTPPTPPTTLVISEWRTDGPNGGNDEFVEIFNPTSAPISLAGYELRDFGGGSRYIYPAVVLAPGQHYLVDRAGFPGPSDDSFPGFANGDSVELRYIPTLTTVDVGLVGVAQPALPRLDGRIDQTYERRFDGCMDTDIWVDDFIHQSEPTPETYTDPPTPC